MLGWANFHFAFRTLWSGFFLYLIGRMLLEFRVDFKKGVPSRDMHFFNRLVILWGIIVALLLFPALAFLFLKIKSYTQIFMGVTMAATLFLITLNLLFSPRLLYGHYWIFDTEPGTSDIPEPEIKSRGGRSQ